MLRAARGQATREQQQRAACSPALIRTVTVGPGISPDRPLPKQRFAGCTAGRDLHPTPQVIKLWPLSYLPTTASWRFGLTQGDCHRSHWHTCWFCLSSSSVIGVNEFSDDCMCTFSHVAARAMMAVPSSESREARTAGATCHTVNRSSDLMMCAGQ